MTANHVKAALQAVAVADNVQILQRFFKTGPGQYGEGDVFIGVKVPMIRQVCKDFRDLPLAEVQKLLESDVHEHRLAAVIILTNAYPRANDNEKQQIFDMYIKNVYSGHINNWDIVDVTAEHIVGAHLENTTERKHLYELARSDGLWQKRVAILSTFRYIKKGDSGTTLDLAEILMHDDHNLIQKAVGWMLREVGKRVDENLLTDFLDKHAHEMPRTQLRYAIEKLSPEKREYYLAARSST